MEQNYEICNALDTNMMEFSAYAILHRAIPSLEDGLKVSLRRILYTMYKYNVYDFTKSANVSGRVMEIHPHGSCYPTIVNMTQKDNHFNTFIDGQGSFGYHTSSTLEASADRYTEIKLSNYSKEMLKGISSHMVKMLPTFDALGEEPSYLPTQHCNLLTHCQEGLAVGMASRFPSFNLKEVCEYTIDRINNVKCYDLVPDFPTGGKLLFSNKVIEEINKNGKGSVEVFAKYKLIDKGILITEIPYNTTTDIIINKIIELAKQDKLKEIVDVIDTTDKHGMGIEIYTKKSVDRDLLMKKLYKLTPLKSSYACNMNCLYENTPMVLGVSDIIDKWIIFRKKCLSNELSYKINLLKTEEEKIKGLLLINNDLDKAIEIIRYSSTEQEAIEKLILYFGLNQNQADYISTIKLINMNKEWLKKQIDKLEDVTSQIDINTKNLSSDEYYNSTIISQLEQISKKYGKPRKTEIIYESELDNKLSQVDLIEDYNCNIVFTKEGYIKKTQKYSDNQKLKDNDLLLQQIKSTNKSKLLLFTDKANMYTINTYDIDECLPSNLGTYTKSLLNLQDENVIYVTSTIDYSGYMLISFKEGYAVKVPLSSYKTTYKKLSNAYSSKFTLLNIMYISNDIDICCKTSDSYYMTFNTSLMNSKDSRKSQGVRIIKVKDGYMNLFQENHLSEVETKACWYDKKLDVTGKKLDI